MFGFDTTTRSRNYEKQRKLQNRPIVRTNSFVASSENGLRTSNFPFGLTVACIIHKLTICVSEDEMKFVDCFLIY